ncbi:MAG: GNAT family N-acetyltransferase [Rhizobiaceae bacterium]|nr:GNAT family N-acetyltransferase [Rhizobiaceae bacterium]
MRTDSQIETERLIIRHWTLSEDDRAFFHFILSDETVRHFYPSRKDRQQADELLEGLVEKDSDSGLKWGVACLKASGRPVGFTGLGSVTYDTPFSPCVEIGWLYHPDVWGQGLATEAGIALLKHGFEDHGLDQIVAFAVHNNRPSIAVMERIGLLKVEDGGFDHPGVGDSHPHLKRHVLYSLTAGDWKAQQ